MIGSLWELIAVAIAAIIGYFLYKTPGGSAVSAPDTDRRDARQVDRADAAQRRKDALEEEYRRLRDEAGAMQGALDDPPDVSDFEDKDELRKWFEKQYG